MARRSSDLARPGQLGVDRGCGVWGRFGLRLGIRTRRPGPGGGFRLSSRARYLTSTTARGRRVRVPVIERRCCCGHAIVGCRFGRWLIIGRAEAQRQCGKQGCGRHSGKQGCGRHDGKRGCGRHGGKRGCGRHGGKRGCGKQGCGRHGGKRHCGDRGCGRHSGAAAELGRSATGSCRV